MNYKNYERKIVEQYSIELIGWPILNPICNPRDLSSNDIAVLRNALAKDQCKGRVLTQEEVDAQVQSNKQCEANGESVYTPFWKLCAQKVHLIYSEIQGDGLGVINEDAA
jgi:hypothetical protein